MTDDDYADLQRRGQGAKALLESEAWQAAYEEARRDLANNWMASDWQANRAAMFAEVKALDRVKARLQEWVSNAKFEFDRRVRERRATGH